MPIVYVNERIVFWACPFLKYNAVSELQIVQAVVDDEHLNADDDPNEPNPRPSTENRKFPVLVAISSLKDCVMLKL